MIKYSFRSKFLWPEHSPAFIAFVYVLSIRYFLHQWLTEMHILSKRRLKFMHVSLRFSSCLFQCLKICLLQVSYKFPSLLYLSIKLYHEEFWWAFLLSNNYNFVILFNWEVDKCYIRGEHYMHHFSHNGLCCNHSTKFLCCDHLKENDLVVIFILMKLYIQSFNGNKKMIKHFIPNSAIVCYGDISASRVYFQICSGVFFCSGYRTLFIRGHNHGRYLIAVT